MIATQVTIRSIQPDDLPELLNMCEAHAAYEGLPFQVNDQLHLLAKGLFSNRPKLYGLVAVTDELVGYSTYMRQYSTWVAKEYLYMDCLFVKEYARSQGIGQQLLEKIVESAWKMGCYEVQWQTPNFNKRAIQFYKRNGASSKTKERFFLTINYIR
ncbi:MAG: GNAT family N-acetyltransferase [Bacteroidota bacterium]